MPRRSPRLQVAAWGPCPHSRLQHLVPPCLSLGSLTQLRGAPRAGLQVNHGGGLHPRSEMCSPWRGPQIHPPWGPRGSLSWRLVAARTRPTVRRWPPGSPVSVSSLWSPHRNALTSCLPRDGRDLTDSFPPRSRDRRVGAEGQRTTSPGTRGWQPGHGARVSESGGWPQSWNVGAEGESLPFLAVVPLSGASGHTEGLSPGKVPGPSPLSPGTLSRLCVWALRGPVKERGASPRQWRPGPQRPLPASPTEKRVWIVLATLAQHLHQGA